MARGRVRGWQGLFSGYGEHDDSGSSQREDMRDARLTKRIARMVRATTTGVTGDLI